MTPNWESTEWKSSKSKTLHTLVFGSGNPSSEEKSMMLFAEFQMDVTMGMMTGNVSSYGYLIYLYDDQKGLFQQSNEFQRQLSVCLGGTIAMSLTLNAIGVTSWEMTAFRHVSIGQVTKYAKHPFVIMPVLGFYLAEEVPEIAGPQYQSAMTGQPSIGSAGKDLVSGRMKLKDFGNIRWD